jgi:uncharacterized coiled-coil DUF342 family protein
MENYPRLQTLKEEKRDPIRTLWRNVLLTAVIDLLKKKEVQFKFKLKKRSHEELWFYEEDFDLVCEYSQYSPAAVRKKVMKAINKMEKQYENKRKQNNMSSMSWKWVYKNSGIGGEQETNSQSMSTV